MRKSILARLKNGFAPSGVAEIDVVPRASVKVAEPITPPPATVKARQTQRQRQGLSHMQITRQQSPTTQTMIVDDLKLVYQPIAKNACSSTKRLVAKLGGVTPNPGQGGIHFILDSQNTGLQFKDRSEADIQTALSAPDWMRFIILRDPMDRLVSAYVEKFVKNRKHPNQRQTIDEVLRAIFEKDELSEDDYEHGITFREFAEYILAEDPNLMNSHWQPQTFYMGHIPFTHMYDVKRLDHLEQDLRDHIGADIELPKINVSREDGSDLEYLDVAPDVLPRDLQHAKRLSVESFIDDDLRMRLTEYYAADFSIYRLIQANNRLSGRL